MVYAGAVMVLFVFIIALLDPAAEDRPRYTDPRFHLNVACHDRLVAFVLLPRNVPAMVVHNQDRPFGARFLVPHALTGPALYYRGLASGLSEGVGSAVDRIAQQAPQCVVGGRSPEGGATGLLRISARQGDALPVEPQQHLTRTSQFRHLRKHQGQHLLDRKSVE